MRKKLTLSISTDRKPYGVDDENNAVLFPEDFRKTVITSIETGNFNDGDVFEVDTNKDGNPIRRSFDQTVAIHRPVEKRYSKSDVIEIVNTAIEMTKRKESFSAQDLLD